MDKKMIVGLVVAVLMVLPLAGACAQPAPEEPAPAPTTEEEGIVTSERQLKIGFFGETTGLWADQTAPQTYGVIDSAKYANEQGGIIFKDPETGKDTRILIDMMQEETGGDVPTAISAYKKFRGEGVDCMTGLTSTQAEGLLALTTKDRQPWQQSTSTPAMHSVLPRYMWTFFPRYEDAAGLALDFISKEDPGCKVGFLSLDISCGRSSVEPVVLEYAESLGLEPLQPELVPFTVTDFSVELSRLKSQGAEWIFATLTSGHAAVMLQDMKRIDWEPDVDCKVFMAQCTQGDQICNVAGYGGFYYAPMLHVPQADKPPAGVMDGMDIIKGYWEKQGGEDRCAYLLTYPLMFCEMFPLYEGVKLAAEEYGWPLTPQQFVHGVYMLEDYNWHNLIPGGVTMRWDRDAVMVQNMPILYYPVDYLETETCQLLETPACPRLAEVAIPDKPVWEE